jgi:HPt (histidine-containing phosphotransfer) domain-containing protein
MDTNKNDGKPYDLSSIFAISEDNPGFLAKLILVFSDNISNDILLINEAAKVGKWGEVGQLAHKMKPSLKHFGVTSLVDVIADLEHQTSANPQHLNSLVNELNSVLNEVLSGLRSEFPEVFNQ